MSEVLYHLNVFGCVYPQHGKQIYTNRRAIKNRLEKYRLEILEKYAGGLRPSEMRDLIESIDNGYTITKIDTLLCPKWELLFHEKPYRRNKKQKRFNNYEDED